MDTANLIRLLRTLIPCVGVPIDKLKPIELDALDEAMNVVQSYQEAHDGSTITG